jgi:hypothetical protein
MSDPQVQDDLEAGLKFSMIAVNASRPKGRTKYARKAHERYDRIVQALRADPAALPVLDVKIKLEWLIGELHELGESV